jgi:hypothetical protein
MVAILFIALADGLVAQQYQITGVEYLGDFEIDEPRDRAIGEAVARQQRQNPGLAYTRTMGFVHFELKMIVELWEDEILEKANIDSLWAVFITPSPNDVPVSKYIIFFQGLPFASNPYYFWIYRGNKR